MEPKNQPHDSARTDENPQAGGEKRRNGSDAEAWLDSVKGLLEYGLKNQNSEQAPFLLEKLLVSLRESGIKIPSTVHTPYVNTIPAEQEPSYPGDREIERRIKSYIRWNAMAMVVKANRIHHGIGGHISTFASCATLYEVGFNHFFRGGDRADIVYFQGHAAPGIYARAFVEWRIDAKRLHRFRQELADGIGLPVLSSPLPHARFLAVPVGLNGSGTHHVDLPGAV